MTPLLQANNVTDLNTPEDKLNWIFTAFDQDGGGSIDVDEIRDIVVGLFRYGMVLHGMVWFGLVGTMLCQGGSKPKRHVQQIF